MPGGRALVERRGELDIGGREIFDRERALGAEQVRVGGRDVVRHRERARVEELVELPEARRADEAR